MLSTRQGKAGRYQRILWRTWDTLPPRPSLFYTNTLIVRFDTRNVIFRYPGFRLLYTFHKVSCSELNRVVSAFKLIIE